MRRGLTGVFVVAAIMGSVGCDTDVDEKARTAFWNGVNTFTLFLYDGQTGAAITNATVAVQVGSHRVVGDGDGSVYVVSQLPEGTFPVLITAPGYLDFVSQYSFNGDDSLINYNGTPNPAPVITYYTATAVLFPNQTVEDDVGIHVYDHTGRPVASGQVVATLDPASSIDAIIGEVDDPLDGQIGLRPAAILSTLSNGAVILPHEQLVLGAVYKVDVFGARDQDGRYLQPARDETFRAGRQFPEIVVFMGPPAICPVAITESNEEGGIQPTLVVTFPYDIEVCSETANHDWTNDTADGTGLDMRDTNNNGTYAIPDDANPVSVDLSADNTTLTLTPNLETTPNSNDLADSLVVTFSGISVRVAGSLTCVSLDSIGLRNFDEDPSNGCTAPGETVNTTITVREQ